MNYVDSNVFISAILNSEDLSSARASISVAKGIARGDVPAFTSLLTWDEVFWAIKKHVSYQIAVQEAGKFLNFPNLEFVKVDRNTVLIAQRMAEKYGLNPRDAIHAATAIGRGAEIISEDPDFDRVKELKRIPPEKFTGKK